MTGPGALVVNPVGVLTAPTAVGLSLGTVIGSKLKDYGLYQAVLLKGKKSVWISHGQEAMRHIVGGASYRIGILAPRGAQTPVSTADSAASVLTITTNPLNLDRIQLGLQPDGSFSEFVYFMTTFNTTTFTVAQVKVGATIAVTINNFNAMIEGTGTNGVEYYDADQMMRNGVYDPAYWLTKHRVQVKAINAGAGTIEIESAIPGIPGNGLLSSVQQGGARMAFSNTPFMAGGVAGTGTAPAAGEYRYAWQHLRIGDGGLSGRSPFVNFTNGDNTEVEQTGFVDAEARYGGTHFRQLRTPVGALNFWRVQDTPVADAEPYLDGVPDGADGEPEGLVGLNGVPYEAATYRLYPAGPPTIGRYSAPFKGSTWYGGALLAADYTRGSVAVVQGDYDVTFTGAKIKEAAIGRTFQVEDDTVEYLIVGVNETTQVVALNRPFEGSTDASADYVISDKRNSNALYYTEPLLPNNSPVRNMLTDITSDDPAGLRGIVSAWDTLVAWTKTGTWRVYGGSGAPYRIQNIGEGMGSWSGHGIVNVDGVLYWIGRGGIYKWAGTGEPQCISHPVSAAGEFPRGIHRTLDRVNADEAEMIVAVYNPSTRLITWAVPLDGDTHNNHVIVYDTQSGAFTYDRAPSITYLALVASEGEVLTLAGSAFGDVYQVGVGNCDGCFGVEPVQQFSSYALATKTASGLVGLPTASGGLAGVPVLHVAADGTRQWNLIESNAATTFKTAYPWGTTPSNGKFVFGGIELRVLTAKYDGGTVDVPKGVDRTILSFAPVAAMPNGNGGQVYYAVAVDTDEPTVSENRTLEENDWCDLSDESGEKEFSMLSDVGNRVQEEFFCLTPGYDVKLIAFQTELVADGALR